jgi:hypothetical protein
MKMRVYIKLGNKICTTKTGYQIEVSGLLGVSTVLTSENKSTARISRGTKPQNNNKKHTDDSENHHPYWDFNL